MLWIWRYGKRPFLSEFLQNWRWCMLSTISPLLTVWGLIVVTSVLFFWRFLRFALSTCDADNMTHGLAHLFCLLLLSAGLALGVMIYNIPVR